MCTWLFISLQGAQNHLWEFVKHLKVATQILLKIMIVMSWITESLKSWIAVPSWLVSTTYDLSSSLINISWVRRGRDICIAKQDFNKVCLFGSEEKGILLNIKYYYENIIHKGQWVFIRRVEGWLGIHLRSSLQNTRCRRKSRSMPTRPLL